MKKHLFYTFLSIFVLTCGITLLGVLKLISIDDFYLKGLFAAFLIELGGAVIAIYRRADFFDVDKTESSRRGPLPDDPRASDTDQPHPPALTDKAIIVSPSNSTTQSSDALSSFILFSIYSQLEKGRVQEVREWFDEFKGEVPISNTELAILQACLDRLCGKRKAFSTLQLFPREVSFYAIVQYELALLRFSKPSDTRELIPPFQIKNLSPGIRKLWGSLLALSYVHDEAWDNANSFFNMIEPTLIEEDAYDAYASAQIGITAAALGQAQTTEKYLFDIARTINRGTRYPIHGYPYASLIAKHNRAFVLAVLGIPDSELSKEDIQLLRGHSHVIARCSHILRLCERALDTIVRISETWPKTRLDKESVKKRLAEFENYFLSNAGTLFLGP